MYDPKLFRYECGAKILRRKLWSKIIIMLKSLLVFTILFTPHLALSVQVDPRIVKTVETNEYSQLITYEQTKSCTIDVSVSKVFSSEYVGGKKYIVPKLFSIRDELGEHLYFEYEYGTVGATFNDALALKADDEDWVGVMFKGFAQKSNEKTKSYYYSRVFPFNIHYPLQREVLFDPVKRIFIMKSENDIRYQVVLFLIQEDGITLQSFGGAKIYYSDLLKELGVSCS